jgi:hypothetical protein
VAFVISAPTDERLNPWKIVHPDQVNPADHHVVPVAAEILGDQAVHLDLGAVPLAAASHTATASRGVQVVRQAVVALEAVSQPHREVDPHLDVQEAIAGEAPQQIESRVIAPVGIVPAGIVRRGIVRVVIARVLIGRVMIVMARIVRVLIVVPQVIALVGIVPAMIVPVLIGRVMIVMARIGQVLIVVPQVIARVLIGRVMIVMARIVRVLIVVPRVIVPVGIVRVVIARVLIGRVMIVMARIVRVLIVVPRVIAPVGIVPAGIVRRGIVRVVIVPVLIVQEAVVARAHPVARCLAVGAEMIDRGVIARRVLGQVRIVLGEGGRIPIVTPRIACERSGQVRRGFPMTLQQRISILAY